jgi:hypothetical protein
LTLSFFGAEVLRGRSVFLTLFRTSLSDEPPFCFTGSPGRYLFYVVVPEFIVGIILMFCGGVKEEKTRKQGDFNGSL